MMDRIVERMRERIVNEMGWEKWRRIYFEKSISLHIK